MYVHPYGREMLCAGRHATRRPSHRQSLAEHERAPGGDRAEPGESVRV